jgi:2-dehydro-3-deoxygalactonokinase
MIAPWLVALDGGTTRTRVRVLHGERIVADVPAAVGVRDVARAGSAAPLHDRLRAAIPRALEALPAGVPVRVVASGMLTSEVGLAAVPHVVAPAGLDDLARGAAWRAFPEVTPHPILLVPGVRTPPADGPDGWTAADVMRGEECEVLALAGDRPPPAGRGALYLIPGSHTKLVAVDASGRIAASHTTLAGELIAALAGGTILAASLPAELPSEPDPEWVSRGAAHAVEAGLARAAFAVRLAALSHQGTPEQRAAWLVGAVVGSDVAHLVRHPLLASRADDRPLVVAGGEPLRSLYAAQLRAAGVGATTAADAGDTAAAIGAARVARRRLELDGEGA